MFSHKQMSRVRASSPSYREYLERQARVSEMMRIENERFLEERAANIARAQAESVIDVSAAAVDD
jgi:hypothetical protein